MKQKKLPTILMLTAFLLCLILTIGLVVRSFDPGVTLEIGDSEYYSEPEIREAMDVVIKQFERGFEGCTLTLLSYEEPFSDQYCTKWAQQYDADQAIILTSSFYVDGSGRNPVLNPNSLYTDYQWILTRSGKGSWKLQIWGYG